MKKIILLSTVFFILFALPTKAEEQIENFDVTIRLNQDSSINVVEKIEYNFGVAEKHGIYRDIPVKYKARGGNYNLRISDVSVVDETGKSYIFETLNKGRYLNIKIGEADKYVSGNKKYIINYKARRAINYFDDYDELYWNVTGDEWLVLIKKVKATILVPEGISREEIKMDCFAGEAGSTGKCFSQAINLRPDQTVEKLVFSNYELSPGEGLTIVAGIPPGFIIKPSFHMIALETVKDNWILLLPFIVFFILFYLWHSKGKDPEGRGIIIPQFEPPQGLSPAQVGTIIDDNVNKHDISADIIDLAIRGYLKIKRIETKGIISNKIDYELELLKNSSDLKFDYERELMEKIFKNSKFNDNGNRAVKLSDLNEAFYKDYEKIKKSIYSSLVASRHFPKSPQKTRRNYMGLAILIIIIGILSSFLFGVFGAISFFLSGILTFVFGFFMPAKTKAGVLAKEHILGLKNYLKVAEKDRIKFHNAPEKNSKVFEKLLPYAMVLKVEEEWAKQFEKIYNQKPGWYYNPSAKDFTAYGLTRDLNNFQAKTNTSLTSRPQASSGGSGFGGGSSSSGFGGGGGGSW